VTHPSLEKESVIDDLDRTQREAEGRCRGIHCITRARSPGTGSGNHRGSGIHRLDTELGFRENHLVRAMLAHMGGHHEAVRACP
jgi:hypothetical protein